MEEVTDPALLVDAINNLNEEEAIRLSDVPSLDVNKLDQLNWAPLHHICSKGMAALAKALISGRADITLDIKTNADETPFSMAVKNQHFEVVQVFYDCLAAD